MKPGLLGVAEQHLQHGIALKVRQLGYAGGETAVDVERLAAGFRMGPDHRVLGLWEAHIGGLFTILMGVIFWSPKKMTRFSSSA